MKQSAYISIQEKRLQPWKGEEEVRFNAHNVSIQVADVFKHLDLPEFNQNSSQHVLLAEKVLSAHKEHDGRARKLIVEEAKRVAEDIFTNWSKQLSS